ncbi:UDP-N-acetylmuramate dehydrogenase [Candidatus Latescibacterota bacterium]
MIESKKNESIAPYTHYKIGGVAREAYFPTDSSELLELLETFSKTGTNYYVLGGGSNVLVGDRYFDGAAILTIHLNKIDAFKDYVECGAGIESSEIAKIALKLSKTGLEFLYLLPGTIGGAIAGNARYDNINISEVLINLVAVHPEKGLKKFKAEDIDFEYKYNSLSKEGWLFCEVSLQWEDGDPAAIKKRMDDIDLNRSNSKHFDFPSSGCIFKNDYKNNIRAGELIDSLGLKGLTIGGAQVAPFHANFIVNKGKATSSDILELIENIENNVLEKTGIKLEREVRMLGNF